MTLKSATEDLSGTTLEAISGCLRRLEYLDGLRTFSGAYWHWGFNKVHGNQAANIALQEAHRATVSEILCTPLRTLLSDVELSSHSSGMEAGQYLERLQEKGEELLPSKPGAGSARHLSSVLHALQGLHRSRQRNATRRASSPLPQPGQLPQPLADTGECGEKREITDAAEE